MAPQAAIETRPASQRRRAVALPKRAADSPTRRPATGKPRKHHPPKVKVAESVFERMMALMDKGIVPWRKPWSSIGRPRSIEGHAYTGGLNIMLLAEAGKAYASPVWGTFRQITNAGGRVRKGEKGTQLVRWVPNPHADDAIAPRPARTSEPVKGAAPETEDDGRDEAEDEEEQTSAPRRFGRPTRGWHIGFFVWNLLQAEPDPRRPNHAKFAALVDEAMKVKEAPASAVPVAVDMDAIIAAMPEPPAIFQTGSAAFYRPATDEVFVPPRGAFATSEAGWATLWHELGHSTGAKHRLARPAICGGPGESFDHFGDARYSREELVAELTVCYGFAELGLDCPEVTENSAAYLDHWRKVLSADKTLIFSAAGAGARAAEYILGKLKKTQEASSTVGVVSASEPA